MDARKLDDDTRKALEQLSSAPAFRRYVEYLRRVSAQADTAAIMQPGPADVERGVARGYREQLMVLDYILNS